MREFQPALERITAPEAGSIDDFIINPEELFRMASAIEGVFIMTYDNTEAVSDLAHKHGFETRAVAMKNTHHAKMTEMLISRNLDWCR
jgi:DNA adenine methylase